VIAVSLVSELPANRPIEPLLTVGIDVGGTKTACVVTDAQDHVLVHEVQPTEASHLPDQLAVLVRRAVDAVEAEARGHVEAIGVAVPGYVEPGSGTFSLAVNLGGRGAILGPQLSERVGLPCYVEHDAASAAAWVSSTSAGRAGDLAYVSLGTGISAGIVLDGEIFRGENGLAGEIGHISAEPDGAPCACGLRGCLEATCTGPAIARMAREGAVAGRQTELGADASAADVFHAAARGDELASEIVTIVSGRLARAIRGLLFTLGVRQIVVGGGVAAAGDDLLRPLLAAIDRERAASALVEAAFAGTTIELLSPDVEAGARGAAALARERVEANQREGVSKR
jgi:glucokinase